MFSVLPLGTNGLYPTKESPTSGYLITADNVNILVDIGSGVFFKLLETLPPENIDAVIISHYHCDHVSDIGVLSYYLQTRNKKLAVYAPSDDSSYQSLIESSPYLDFKPLSEDLSLDFSGLKISFFRMNHPVMTYGLRFSKDGKVLSYTSDSALSDSFEKLLFCADMAIVDCGFLYDNWSSDKPLISARHVGILGKRYNVKTVLLSHLNPTLSSKELIEEAKSEYSACYLIEHKNYYI